MKSTLPAVAVVICLLGAPADSNEMGARDPNDTKGRLDVRLVRHGHTEAGALKHRLSTFGEWHGKALSDGRHSSIDFWFSTDREDRYAEFRATVDRIDGELQACLGSYAEGSDFAGVGPCEPIQFRRPNGRTVVIVFPAAMIGDPDRYAWSGYTYYRNEDSEHCRRSCIDEAPDGARRGKIVHLLGEHSTSAPGGP